MVDDRGTTRRFLETASLVTPLLTDPRLAASWAGPSALKGWTVGELAAHVVRAVVTVERYLEGGDPPSGESLDAAGYLGGIDGLGGGDGPDLDGELHQAILDRARRGAAGGPAALLGEWERTLDTLTAALSNQHPGRRIAVLGGRAMDLDEYLVTRMIELAVHADDLAVSLGIETPDFPAEATGPLIDTLVTVARRRHGDRAVLRALTRVERDSVRALRVL